MVSLYQFTLYILLVLAISYCPGPTTMFSMATSMQLGLRATFPALLGGTSAYVVQLAVVSFGLSLILEHSELALATLEWLGAAYLIYLGIKQWLNKASLRTQTTEARSINKIYVHLGVYARGFVVGITNPKGIILATVVYPQFTNPATPQLPQLLLLSALFLPVQFSGALSYACFGSKVFKWLKKKNKEQILYKMTGIIFIGAGILLASLRK